MWRCEVRLLGDTKPAYVYTYSFAYHKNQVLLEVYKSVKNMGLTHFNVILTDNERSYNYTAEMLFNMFGG